MDEALEYTGSGGELFLGFVAVFFLILLPLGVINNLAALYLEPLGLEFVVFTALFYIVIFFLIGMAIYRARRYRLSRTRWRGIRGAMVGSSAQYAIRYLLFWGLTAISLGWAYPWMRVKLFKRIMEETRFGESAFRAAPALAPLYRIFAVCWSASALSGVAVLLFVHFTSGLETLHVMIGERSFSFWLLALAWPLLLLLWIPWYKAREFNHLAAATSFIALSFRMDVTVWNLVRLSLPNLLIVIATLGFGQPFAQLRTFRFFCERLHTEGDLDTDWIEQSRALAPSVGEGLADAFDLGAV
jgi:uncharacterized membrane protein YjgN (DUF898 family)